MKSSHVIICTHFNVEKFYLTEIPQPWIRQQQQKVDTFSQSYEMETQIENQLTCKYAEIWVFMWLL